MQSKNFIGIFDSGYGGLTVMKEIIKLLPDYDYIYLGDNARTPYGNRSFDTVYHFTLQGVNWLLQQNCKLIILACNTASAKALRTIQQNDLPKYFPDKKILGVIRPTTELVGKLTSTNKIGILATKGTVNSNSYKIEINKFFPEVEVFQHACPMWVPLIENNEHTNDGADYFIKNDIDLLFKQNKNIDLILLGCTHYPLLEEKIKKYLPKNVKLISQGKIVAESLNNYLHRHPEIASQLSQHKSQSFYTTDSTDDFDTHAKLFFGNEIKSIHTSIDGGNEN